MGKYQLPVNSSSSHSSTPMTTIRTPSYLREASPNQRSRYSTKKLEYQQNPSSKELMPLKDQNHGHYITIKPHRRLKNAPLPILAEVPTLGKLQYQ